jgi:chemotaxis protein methyltransferase CheR
VQSRAAAPAGRIEGTMLTDEEFRLFRSLIHQESGMFLKDGKKDFLENKLAKRMKATNITTPYWYYRFVTENRQQELIVLLDSLTVNETAFFRNLPQFDLFRNVVLPDLVSRKRASGDRTLRIWSAGSSTGEEPYSIAIAVLQTLFDASDWDIRIFASDISLKCLETAHRGEYAAARVRGAVPDALVDRYFREEAGAYRVQNQVRRLVIFDYHNLKHEGGPTLLDAVFCRNVMIYFDEEEQKRLVNKFHRSLVPGGYLLLGHSESLYGWNMDFQFVYEDKGTAYRKSQEVLQCGS